MKGEFECRLKSNVWCVICFYVFHMMNTLFSPYPLPRMEYRGKV